MKLFLVSSETGAQQETELVNHFFEKGLMHFHLRKPSWAIDETRTYLDQLNPLFYSMIVPHDHYELVHEYGLKGIHFNERNKVHFADYKIQNTQKSTSIHSLEELEDNPSDEFDYAFLSPVFDSISKAGYKSTFDLDDLQSKLKNRSKKSEVVALGGVNAKNFLRCKAIGFDGAAVLGAVWNSPQPLESFIQLNKLCQTSAIQY